MVGLRSIRCLSTAAVLDNYIAVVLGAMFDQLQAQGILVHRAHQSLGAAVDLLHGCSLAWSFLKGNSEVWLLAWSREGSCKLWGSRVTQDKPAVDWTVVWAWSCTDVHPSWSDLLCAGAAGVPHASERLSSEGL